MQVSIYRRNGEKESSANTLLRLSIPLPPGSLVVGDSYFGGLQTLEGLARAGKYGLLSCTCTRPSFLFKDCLVNELVKDADCSSRYGKLAGRDEKDFAFIANAFQSQGRNLFTLSTAFSSLLQSVEISGFVDDDTEEQQQIPHHSEEKRPEVRNKYSAFMDFTDKANAAVPDGMCKTRKHHWSAAVMQWMLSMLLCVNGKRCYISATGQNKDNPEWRLMLREELTKETVLYCEPLMQDNCIGRCRACSFLKKLERRTTKLCTRCGFICKHCANNGDHARYAKLHAFMSSNVRRTYLIGHRSSSQKKLERTMVNKLLY